MSDSKFYTLSSRECFVGTGCLLEHRHPLGLGWLEMGFKTRRASDGVVRSREGDRVRVLATRRGLEPGWQTTTLRELSGLPSSPLLLGVKS